MLIPVQVRILASPPLPGNIEAIGPNRAAIESQLSHLPEQQLVLVRYGADHDSQLEWVYNGADPDHAKIVWARDMGPEKNRELLSYYGDRRVWLLDADAISPQLVSLFDLCCVSISRK